MKWTTEKVKEFAISFKSSQSDNVDGFMDMFTQSESTPSPGVSADIAGDMPFKIDEVRFLLKRLRTEEISFSKTVELLNEKAMEHYSNQPVEQVQGVSMKLLDDWIKKQEESSLNLKDAGGYAIIALLKDFLSSPPSLPVASTVSDGINEINFAEWLELEGYKIKGMDDTQRQKIYFIYKNGLGGQDMVNDITYPVGH